MYTYENLRNNYKEFYYRNYNIEEKEKHLHITYTFEIPGLSVFTPSLDIPIEGVDLSSKDTSFIEYLAFHIGLVELISYWKNVCPRKVIIESGYLSEDQILWFKNLYFNGLGEFFYTNEISTTIEDFMEIVPLGKKQKFHPIFQGEGNLIPVGGGKDSCVTLSLLEREKERNTCFIINPNEITLSCCHAASYEDQDILCLKRTLDKRMVSLKDQGYLNGHTPFSSMVAFTSYLTAYLHNKKYITLSNESSANEANVCNTNVNHQYSKSYTFEKDFYNYTKNYFGLDITYLSLLRPLSEYQIGMLFSKLNHFLPIFKSCNVGSKHQPWKWCCHCPKCLFVYTILSPHLYKEKLISIFGEDMFTNEKLLPTFIDLLGFGKTKPFECVGTFKEVNYAISKTISMLKSKKEKLPFLLHYFKEHYRLTDKDFCLEEEYNDEHNLPKHFEEIVKGRLYHDR